MKSYKKYVLKRGIEREKKGRDIMRKRHKNYVYIFNKLKIHDCFSRQNTIEFDERKTYKNSTNRISIYIHSVCSRSLNG